MAALLLWPGVGQAQDGWNPFAEQDRERATRRAPSERRDPVRPLEPFAPGDEPWRDRANQGRPADTTRDGTGRTRYRPPPPPGAPVFPQDETTVQRRELAPIVVPSANAPPAAHETQPQRRARPAFGSSPDPAGPRSAAVNAQPMPRGEIWPELTRETFQRYAQLLPDSVASPTLARLWIGVAGAAPLGSAGPGGIDEALAGLSEDSLFARGLLKRSPPPLSPSRAREPIVKTVLARSTLLSGDDASACPVIRDLLSDAKSLPKPLFGELLTLGGVCAIATGNPSGAPLAAQLAREAGHPDELAINLLEAFQSGDAPALPNRARLSGVQAAIIARYRAAPSADVIARSAPPALTVLAITDGVAPPLRIAAAERAATINAIDTEDLVEAYRSASRLERGSAASPATQRARLWLAVEDNRAFIQRARNIRAYLDAAKSGGIYTTALRVAATVLDDLPQVAEIGWFAETAIEVALAGDHPRLAAAWAEFADGRDGRQRGTLGHWRALIDIATADSNGRRGEDLLALERLALGQAFDASGLHRLVTVLDALNYQVPIGLWNVASAAPQPTGGHLPPTGVLRELADAAQAGAIGPTILLAMATLGPDGSAGANILALGDTIRALRRVGLEEEARRLAFEAVFPIWPRNRTN